MNRTIYSTKAIPYKKVNIKTVKFRTHYYFKLMHLFIWVRQWDILIVVHISN